jgi:5-methyltetrahydropteroyltriglutamate--homocysteine methyltransferase
MSRRMQRSTDRFLTTHTGSLPRSAPLLELLKSWTPETAQEVSSAPLVKDAVAAVVARQVAAGIDIVSDGDQGKPGFCNYLSARMDGISGTADPWTLRDLAAVPELFAFYFSGDASPFAAMPACEGELHYHGEAEVTADLDTLRSAMSAAGAKRGFVTAPSPGCIATHITGRHYDDYEAYLFAAAEAMRPEYAAIAKSGLTLQLDSPDLAAIGHTDLWMSGFVEQVGFRRYAELNVEAMNIATEGLDPESMRIHLCWGNYEGPHHLDSGLADVIDIVLSNARPAAVGFEAANPRHEHEWEIFRDVAIPDDKVLIPGVIDTTTNFVEHPRLVAQRIGRFADLVGRERVVAGTDCGFGTFAGVGSVFSDVVWLKLESLVEGARLATDRFW